MWEQQSTIKKQNKTSCFRLAGLFYWPFTYKALVYEVRVVGFVYVKGTVIFHAAYTIFAITQLFWYFVALYMHSGIEEMRQIASGSMIPLKCQKNSVPWGPVRMSLGCRSSSIRILNFFLPEPWMRCAAVIVSSCDHFWGSFTVYQCTMPSNEKWLLRVPWNYCYWYWSYC